MKLFASNKKAYHLYIIVDTLEVGIVLTGNEVKSVRAGHVSLQGSYATIHGSVLSLLNCHIARYNNAYGFSKEGETRTRILLAHKREISKLQGLVSAKRMTLVPLKMYVTKKGHIKIEIGVAKHKNVVDKKQELKERDLDRQARREIKDY